LIDWLVVCLVICLVGWLVGWLFGWLVGWLVVWLVGWLTLMPLTWRIWSDSNNASGWQIGFNPYTANVQNMVSF